MAAGEYVSASSLLFLALLGSLAVHAGGSSLWRALAMGQTAAVGARFGAAV